jgi:hypothetical protein
MWLVIGIAFYVLLLFLGVLFLRCGKQADDRIKLLEDIPNGFPNQSSHPENETSEKVRALQKTG